jgi:hypothetical protein
MAARLKCDKCGQETAMPAHCNRPMHAERVNGELKLVCWMGADCASDAMPQHCGTPMREVAA